MKPLKLPTPRRLQLMLLALPMLLALLYYSVFAADRYVSESVITVRQASQTASHVPGAALLLAGITPPSREDTLYLMRYVHSLDLLRVLDAKLKLREHLASPHLDPFYRLWDGSTQETFLRAYRNRVEVGIDDLSGLLTLRVQGFDPDYAQALNAAILEHSERFVNAFSQRMAREQMAFAETELARASEQLQAAQARLLDYQTRNRVLDPAAQAQASGVLTTELQAQLTRLEAELKDALGYLNEDAHPVKALRNRIAALRAQLDVERLRGTAPAGAEGNRLNAQAMQFHELQARVLFAQDAYKLALTAVENARIDASRKLKSVVVIDNPSRPEDAYYPRRIYSLLTILLVCTLLYVTARLVVATIRDHQD